MVSGGGDTQGGIESWALAQNPGPKPVCVDFTLNTGLGGQVPDLQDVETLGCTRRTFNIGNYVTTYDVSTMVGVRDGDMICERAMCWTPSDSGIREQGHNSAGFPWALFFGS